MSSGVSKQRTGRIAGNVSGMTIAASLQNAEEELIKIREMRREAHKALNEIEDKFITDTQARIDEKLGLSYKIAKYVGPIVVLVLSFSFIGTAISIFFTSVGEGYLAWTKNEKFKTELVDKNILPAFQKFLNDKYQGNASEFIERSIGERVSKSANRINSLQNKIVEIENTSQPMPGIVSRSNVELVRLERNIAALREELKAIRGEFDTIVDLHSDRVNKVMNVIKREDAAQLAKFAQNVARILIEDRIIDAGSIFSLLSKDLIYISLDRCPQPLTTILSSRGHDNQNIELQTTSPLIDNARAFSQRRELLNALVLCAVPNEAAKDTSK